MASVTIHQGDDAIRVQRFPHSAPGESFHILYVGSDVGIVLRGDDHAAVANARAIAAVLTTAADELDFKLALAAAIRTVEGHKADAAGER